MDIYQVKGRFMMGRRYTPFTKEVAGKGKDDVREYIFSVLGSMHNVRRRFIVIESMQKIPAKDASDPIAIYKAGKK